MKTSWLFNLAISWSNIVLRPSLLREVVLISGKIEILASTSNEHNWTLKKCFSLELVTWKWRWKDPLLGRQSRRLLFLSRLSPILSWRLHGRHKSLYSWKAVLATVRRRSPFTQCSALPWRTLFLYSTRVIFDGREGEREGGGLNLTSIKIGGY